MRWLRAGVGVLAVLAMTGCPSEFGKDGRISKAVRKDATDPLVITACSKKRFEEACAAGKEETPQCRACRQ